MADLAERFLERFRGLDRAHGVYRVRGKAVTGKKHEGAAKTLRTGPTRELWEQHLDGSLCIGVVPIRDDATCRFGAVDIDDYKGLDHNAIEAKIAAWELPLMVVRSKSGGAHLYLFGSEGIPAELMRTKLMEWSVQLGFSGVEIFPKQTRLAGQSDIGNWINMPYFAAATAKGKAKGRGERFCYYKGKPITATKFLDIADSLAVDTETLQGIEPPTGEEFKELLHEAPPCLQTLLQRGGIASGARNNGLFNVGVYLRKRFGEDWEEHLDTYNNEVIQPPLGHREVVQIAKSVNRKAYEYKCGDQPICDVCNRQICRSREFGVGVGDGDPGVQLGQLIQLLTDPVTWIWDVDGARIELTTRELKEQARWHTRVIEELRKWPLTVKPAEWAKIVRVHLAAVEVQEVPEDARPVGQMRYHLASYCTQDARARSKDGLLQNKPYTENGRVFFHGPHFHQYLRRQGITVNARTLWNWLREMEADTHFFNIKGKGINVWSVPAFDEQTEALDVPVIDNVDPM